MIHVCITDDHHLVLEGLRMLIHQQGDINVTRTCKSGEELLNYLSDGALPDVVLLDINMPGLNGIETCQRVKKEYPRVRIIGLSMIAESHLVKLMLKNGADGYLHKNVGSDEIIAAIHDVMHGRTHISDEISSTLMQSKAESTEVSNSPFPKLSAREKEILAMIIDEKTTQEIADKLYISFGTVETHRRNMLIKLGAKNTAGLVRVALEYKLV